jgi:hypothetical protein
MIKSIRVPLNDEYIWHYYILQNRVEEDLYMYKAMDEHIVSHILIIKNLENELKHYEPFMDELMENFEIPPLLIIHSLQTPEPIIRMVSSGAWQMERNVYLTCQISETLPLAVWNRICTRYLKEEILNHSRE